MPVDSLRVISDLEELRALTADDHGAQRLAWSPMWLKARDWFQNKLEGLPVEHHYDAAGNSWTTLRGESDRALVLGSHLDSVPNGGWSPLEQAANIKDLQLGGILPGIKVNTSATDFAPIAQLQLMKFKGDKWDLFGEIISGDVGG